MILVLLYGLACAFLIARAGVWLFRKLDHWPPDDAGISHTVIPFHREPEVRAERESSPPPLNSARTSNL